MKRPQHGFTIVELLIVIVIIGILAAITIVAYNGIQERARVNSVTSALKQAQKKLSLYQVDNPDQYPVAAGIGGMDNLNTIGITNSSGTSYQYSSSTGTYCLTATTGSTSYKLSNTSTTPTQGGCAGHGVGGADAITNLATNPSFETSLAGFSWHTTNGSSISQSNAWSQTGSYSIQVNRSTNGSADTFAQVPGSWFTPALQPGSQVSVAGYLRLTQSGSAVQDGRARRIHLVVNTASGNVVLQTAAAPNTAGVHLVRGVLTVPANFTSFSFARLYNGHSDIEAWWDSVTVVAGDHPNLTPQDGNSPNWIWNGTANNSTSTGPAS